MLMFVTGKGEAEDRPGGEGFVLLAAVGRVQVHLVQHQRPRPALVQTLQQHADTSIQSVSKSNNAPAEIV